jgi:hypothetical protein
LQPLVRVGKLRVDVEHYAPKREELVTYNLADGEFGFLHFLLLLNLL